MTPSQEIAYADHLATLEQEHEAAFEDWKKYPITPFVSDDAGTTNP